MSSKTDRLSFSLSLSLSVSLPPLSLLQSLKKGENRATKNFNLYAQIRKSSLTDHSAMGLSQFFFHPSHYYKLRECVKGGDEKEKKHSFYKTQVQSKERKKKQEYYATDTHATGNHNH